MVYQPVMLKLAELGHNVTIITPIPSNHESVTEIDTILTRVIWDRVTVPPGAYIQNFELYFSKMEGIITNMFQNPSVAKLVKGDEKFDAVICETMLLAPINAFARHFNAPLIVMHSMDLLPVEHAILGNVVHPILHPHTSLPYHGKLSFWDRCLAVYLHLFMDSVLWKRQERLDRITEREFGQNWKSDELMRDVDFAIITSHPALDNVRPIVPSTVQIGFLHIVPKAQVSPKQEYRFKKQSVYVYLGPFVRSNNIGDHVMQTLRNVFKQLDEYLFFWTWNGKEWFDDIPNLHIFGSIPQQSVLSHEQVKLFITHGGQQSMEESIDRTIPMLVIPFFDDQISNARKVEHLGIGRKLELADLNESSLKEMILEVAGNSR